jgi:integrase
MARLTDITIRNAKPDTQDRLLSDGGNLFLRVRPNGSKGWIVRVKRQGKRRVHTLGAWPKVSILKARADAARIVAEERGTATVKVREAVEHYMDAMIRPRYRRVGNAEVYARRLQDAVGDLSVDLVRPVDVSRMVADYRREAPVASMRCLGFARGFFGWCVQFGYLERSPVSDVKARAFGVVEEARERTLTDDEIRAFWHADDLAHVPLLRFLLLTGLRIGEAQAAQVAWIDADHWLRLPADVMKVGKPHECYLSKLARTQIVAEAKPHLFRVVTPTAVQSALKRWQERHSVETRWTAHDLRRSYASRLGDLGTAPHVIAKALAHSFTPSASLPTYLRSEWREERAKAAEGLAAHVSKLVKRR